METLSLHSRGASPASQNWSRQRIREKANKIDDNAGLSGIRSRDQLVAEKKTKARLEDTSSMTEGASVVKLSTILPSGTKLALGEFSKTRTNDDYRQLHQLWSLHHNLYLR